MQIAALSELPGQPPQVKLTKHTQNEENCDAEYKPPEGQEEKEDMKNIRNRKVQPGSHS